MTDSLRTGMRTIGHAALGLLMLVVIWAIGARYDAWKLEFAAIHLSKPSVLRFNTIYTLFGGLAALFFAQALAPLLQRRPALKQHWLQPGTKPFLGFAMLLAFLLPLAARQFLLHGMPTADDERVYGFAARLLTEGLLAGSSHPMPEFFDHHFVINDGYWYAQYFLGWPALLAPWTFIGLPGFANPFYAALTVPGIYLVARRLVGEGLARIAVVLHVFAPMWILLSAGLLSHTTCTMALTWVAWASLRSRDEDAPVWIDTALAVLFCLAFFIRPLTAVAMGFPLLGWWFVGAWRHPRRLLAFAVPAALAAGLFLAINTIQNGGPLKTGYSAYWEFLERNDFRNNERWGRRKREPGFLPNLRLTPDRHRLRLIGEMLYRLNYAWLGWPISFLFVVFAPFRKHTRLIWLMLLFAVVGMMGVADIGIDTIAPVHFAEVSLPLLWLTIAGIHRIRTATQPLRGADAWLGATLASLVLVAYLAYVPVRWAHVAAVGDSLNRPHLAVEAANLPRSVLFYKRGFAKQCPSNHFVFNGPINDPDFDEHIVYAFDHGPKKNRLLMERHFPDRRPFKLKVDRKACTYEVVPGP